MISDFIEEACKTFNHLGLLLPAQGYVRNRHAKALGSDTCKLAFYRFDTSTSLVHTLSTDRITSTSLLNHLCPQNPAATLQ